MPKSRPRLGKGLSAIVGQRPAPSDGDTSAEAPADQPLLEPDPSARATIVRSLPIESVVPNPAQPRADFDPAALAQLADSIHTHGLVQPIVVRPDSQNRYQIVVGERRWRAARDAGLAEIPAVIRQASDPEALELALVENLQREDLNPIERASAYRQYLDTFGGSTDQLAKRLGESRAGVANYLRLLGLDTKVREFVKSRLLGMGQARAIAGIADPRVQLALARQVIRRNLSTRQIEALVKREGAVEPERLAAVPSVHTSNVEQSLAKGLGLPVKLYPGRKKNSGRIVIGYASLDEFDRIAERICGKPALE